MYANKYVTKSMSECENNCLVFEREALAVVLALDKLHMYFEWTHLFLVLTD